MSDGDWQRRAPYEDRSSAPGGGGRRRAGAAPQPQDSYGQDPYAQDPYAQPPQGYAQPSYGGQPGYAAAPPPPPPPAAGPSSRGRRAAPRSGPKVVQSEVIDPAAQDYGRAAHDGYGNDPYAQGGDPYGHDDGWSGTTSQGYAGDRYDDGRYDDSRYDDGLGDVYSGDGGPGDGWGDDDFMDGGPPRRSKLRAWAPLFALIVVLGAFSGCMYGGYTYYKSKHGPAPDFTNANCPANDPSKDPIKDQGKVAIEIPPGAIGAKIGQILFDGGVVKSVRAYVNAANSDQSSSGIASGTYDVCKGLSGAAAVKELLKAGNIEKNSMLDVKSHEWSTEVIQWLVDHRHWQKSDFDAAIKNNTIGLPAWSKIGNDFTVEGMLEPGQYTLSSKDTPQSVLKAMVQRRMDKLNAIGFEAAAAKLTCGSAPCTPEKMMIIASLAEAEVNTPSDASGVAEGVFNRLSANDFLGIDSTAMYGLQSRKPPTQAEVNDPNDLYATGSHKGLPPGPVAIPSIDTITAVLKPTNNKVYYWCAKGATTTFYKKTQLSLFTSQCLNAPKS